MLKPYLFLFPLFFYSIAAAQIDYETERYAHQLELRHDNDFFLLTDRYYSSGLFLTYRTMLKRGVFGEKEQLAIRLGQEVFTPSQTQSVNSNLYDRPYVGFTGLHSQWSLAEKKSLYTLGVLLGLAGNNSGAGGFQRWYHKAVAISDSPLWIDELNNSFHTNLYGVYTKEWEIAPNPFGIRFAMSPKLAFGTRDIFGEAEAMVHFGRRNAIAQSIAYNRLGDNAREIYFALRFAYRQVFHNGLIEGNLFGDNSTVTREPENSIVRFGFDFNHRFDQNDYKVGIRYNSAEAVGAESHIYVQLSYAFSW